MSRKRKPPAQDWKSRKIEDWTATTFNSYLKDLHQERFKLPYVCNNWAMQGKMIKNMYTEFGKEVTKEFIDLCFKHVRPSGNYKTIGFIYLYSYFRERFLGKAIKNVELKNRVSKVEYDQQQQQQEEVWF